MKPFGWDLLWMDFFMPENFHDEKFYAMQKKIRDAPPHPFFHKRRRGFAFHKSRKSGLEKISLLAGM